MRGHRGLALIYLLFFGIMIFMNYTVGTDVSGVADANETIIQPAGFAFSIWGIIYLLLFLWIIRMLTVKNTIDAIQMRLQLLPIINFLLNGAWIIAFAFEAVLISTIIIVLLWVSIFAMYQIVSKENYHWLDRLPLSMYLGWVSLATVVNVFTLVDATNFTYPANLDEMLVTTLVIGVVTICIIFFSMANHDWVIPIVGIWTYTAILVDVAQPDLPLTLVVIVSNALFIMTALVNFITAKNRYKAYR